MRHEPTIAEKVLWSRLRDSQIGSHFRQQQIIDGFIVDFYCHSAALSVEVDGGIHDPEYYSERDRILADRGIKVIRFKNVDVVKRIGWVLSQIKKEIAVRTYPTPPEDR